MGQRTLLLTVHARMIRIDGNRESRIENDELIQRRASHAASHTINNGAKKKEKHLKPYLLAATGLTWSRWGSHLSCRPVSSPCLDRVRLACPRYSCLPSRTVVLRKTKHKGKTEQATQVKTRGSSAPVILQGKRGKVSYTAG